MTYLTLVRSAIAASALTFVGTFAQAATVASLSSEGTISVYETTATASGSYSIFYDEDLWDATDSSAQLVFSASLDLGTKSWADSLTASKAEITAFITSVLSSAIGGDVMDLIDYIISNTGDPFDIDGDTLVFTYDDSGDDPSTPEIEGTYEATVNGGVVSDLSRTYEYALDASVETLSPVPLPASAPLLAAGLGALWLRRKRKA